MKKVYGSPSLDNGSKEAAALQDAEGSVDRSLCGIRSEAAGLQERKQM